MSEFDKNLKIDVREDTCAGRFTDKTIKALDVAKCIAKKNNAEIALIHVVKAALAVYMDELGIYKSKSKTGQKFLEEIIEQNERKMEKYMEKLESEGLKISYKLKIDSSPDKIAELVADVNLGLFPDRPLGAEITASVAATIYARLAR